MIFLKLWVLFDCLEQRNKQLRYGCLTFKLLHTKLSYAPNQVYWADELSHANLKDYDNISSSQSHQHVGHLAVPFRSHITQTLQDVIRKSVEQENEDTTKLNLAYVCGLLSGGYKFKVFIESDVKREM